MCDATGAVTIGAAAPTRIFVGCQSQDKGTCWVRASDSHSAASGKFVYAANGFGLSAFTINASTGALTVLSASPFGFIVNANPTSVAISGTIQ
jgi:hypothetical protein